MTAPTGAHGRTEIHTQTNTQIDTQSLKPTHAAHTAKSSPHATPSYGSSTVSTGYPIEEYLQTVQSPHHGRPHALLVHQVDWAAAVDVHEVHVHFVLNQLRQTTQLVRMAPLQRRQCTIRRTSGHEQHATRSDPIGTAQTQDDHNSTPNKQNPNRTPGRKE